jgi:glycosyltransferase involved in cell wall biosynthesis
MLGSKGLSVVVPAYNRATVIGHTLSSLLCQTLPADEIIIVDDGSSDGTEDAARAAFHRWESEKVKSKRCEGGRVPEFKVIRQENAGPGAARNRGFAESKGEFIHFFDSDDIAAPNKHEVQVRALQQTGADIAYGPWVKGYIMHHGAEPRLGEMALRQSGEHGGQSRELGAQNKHTRYSFHPRGPVLQSKGLPSGDLIKQLLTRWSIVPHACLFRRSIVRSSGGFPEDMYIAEDQLMFLRCLLAGARVVHTPETLEFYRLDEKNKLTAHGTSGNRHRSDWARFLVSAQESCQAHGVDPCAWFGFRKRCWLAKADLMKIDQTNGTLQKLTRLIGGPISAFLCSAASIIDPLEIRLSLIATGFRRHGSFRCGNLTPHQAGLFS